jgi:hypothetical protein
MAALSLPARRTAYGYDFSGRASFAGGAFAVTALSGMRAHITFGSQGGGGFGLSSGPSTPVRVKSHSVLVEQASVAYRITGLAGALTTAFAGVTPPQCDALGVCDTRGRLVQSFSAHGTVRFSGARIIRRTVGPSRALADLRRGTMALSDDFAEQAVHQTVDETSTQTGSVSCHATTSTLLTGGVAHRPRHGSDDLALGDAFAGFGDIGPDPFRTACAGPSAHDVLGPSGGTLAMATVTAGQLGGQRLSLTFRHPGTFHAPGYTGRRGGAVVLTLALVRSTGRTRRVTLFDGEPLIP